jgi:pyruvate formate-lyase/glycerol dehydratase family glycyl radical enzyme
LKWIVVIFLFQTVRVWALIWIWIALRDTHFNHEYYQENIIMETATQAFREHYIYPPLMEISNVISPRIIKLRELALTFANEPDPTERGKALMDSYDETAAEPIIIRRAKAVTRILETQSLVLDEGQLIVGRVQRLIPAHYGIHSGYEWKNPVGYPEGWSNHLPKDSPVSESFRIRWEEWHKGYISVWQKLNALVPEDERLAMQSSVYHSQGIDWVHRNSRFQMLLELGLAEIKKQAQDKLFSLDETCSDDVNRKSFYESIIIVCDAIIDYAERWSNKLNQMAEFEKDDLRSAELKKMSDICRRVPKNPPKTFHEAIQSIWLIQIANYAEASGSAHSFGRFDQYMLPFYTADIDAGCLTNDEALELIQCLWLCCYSTFDFRHITVGGIKPDGSDGTNELSYLCLEATEGLKTPKDIAVRIHKNTPESFLRKAVSLTRLGLGRPDYWNDEVTIEALTKAGIPLEDARDYSAIGCVELTIAGKCNSRTMGHSMNLSKCLELALNNGCDELTGKQVGLKTGKIFYTYEELHAAYRKQASHFIRLAIQQNIRAYMLQARDFPMPVLSTLTEGCLESGHDVMDGGAIYNFSGVNLFGIANVANSLASIKKLVFEDKGLSLGELHEAFKSNFEGYESLRQMLRNRMPKYGNGDEYVDIIASEEAAFYCDEVAKYPTPEGGKHHALIFGVTGEAIYSLAKMTGASADGRKAGESLAMSASAEHGTEKVSATATLKSAARLDYNKVPGGVSFILDLHPTAVEGESGQEKLMLLLRTFFNDGGMEIGLNILSEEELRKAQKNPRQYSHIMVRVFGFSTQFISLSDEIQEYVIEKAKQV